MTGRAYVMPVLTGVFMLAMNSSPASDTRLLTAQVTPVPRDVLRVPDAEQVLRAVQETVKIVDSAAAAATSVSNVTLQGVGPAVRYDLAYSISVRSTDPETRFFRILTEVAGELRARSTRYGIRPGQTVRKSERVIFTLPRLGLALTGILDPGARPVIVRVIDDDGTEYDRVALAIASVPSGGEPSARQDLRIYRLRAEQQAPGDRANPSKEWSIRATLQVANTGSGYWNVPASVTVTYAQGRGGRTRPIDGLAGTTKPIPPGIASGDSVELELRTQRKLSPGSYTATARLTSRDDEVTANNLVVYEFYVTDR